MNKNENYIITNLTMLGNEFYYLCGSNDNEII